MTPQGVQMIVIGTVVEFFEAKQILCGVCQSVKSQRLGLLTEQNKEMSLAMSRVIHAGTQTLNMNLSRDELVGKLAAIASLRRSLMKQVDAEELWSLLEGESEGHNAGGLAEFIFSDSITENHVAAVQRVLFQDKVYFQFKDGEFYPRSREKVEQRKLEIEREEEREAQLEEGARWLQAVWNRKPRPVSSAIQDALIEKLKSFCLFGQESSESAFVKDVLKRANITPLQQSAFRLLVRLGVWREDENLFLHEQNISVDFAPTVIEAAETLALANLSRKPEPAQRKDLRHLHSFTIDSALTRDYDDALSLERLGSGMFQVGVHIADAAEFIAKDDLLDEEAKSRISSIYLPDGRIAMLPPVLSEGTLSLRAGEDRLAQSFLFKIDTEGVIHEQEIVHSIIRISRQMTYEEVNERVGHEPDLEILYELALRLRKERLDRGAIILPLPEIHVFVNDVGMIQISRYEKETPSQIMVSEWMIAANRLAAAFLAERNIPSIFRSQADCRPETNFIQSEHELFQVYRQRRLFSRAEMSTDPRSHCSLALPCYTTVTSPIRRYSDLVVQRQLKNLLNTGESGYGEEELGQLITRIGAVQSKIFQIQRKWTRYWILKYMEQEDLAALNALVLDRNERFYHLLLPDFLMETNAPIPEKIKPQPGEMVRVKIERLSPREDVLRVQLVG